LEEELGKEEEDPDIITELDENVGDIDKVEEDDELDIIELTNQRSTQITIIPKITPPEKAFFLLVSC